MKENITLFAEPIFHYGSFTITNALITSWVVVGIIIVISLFLRAKLKTVPGKFQNIFEIVIEAALDLCDQVTGDRALSMKIFPIAISVFFFILLIQF